MCKAIAENEDNVGKDYCCFSTYDGVNGDYKCSLDSHTTDPELSIKEEATSDTKTFHAWMWNAGEEVDIPEETEDEESAAVDQITMISSATATIAAIAMFAYWDLIQNDLYIFSFIHYAEGRTPMPFV